MRDSFGKYVLIATFGAGMAFAQTPTAQPGPGTAKAQPERREYMRGHWDLDRLTQVLNLTDSQKARAQTIFQNARQSAQPIREELKQNREKLTAAAKVSNNDTEIQKLATEQGRLMGKLIAIRTQASAKFYQILTPEQRVKADEMHERFRERMRSERPGTEPEPR